MRYRLTTLMLFTVLSVMLFTAQSMMNVQAAPVPDPWAILAIGPSPDPRETDEKYRKSQKEAQTHIIIFSVSNDPEVKKLPSIARMKDASAWLTKNLRVTEEDRGRRLRFKFRAGSRAEQVTILNALLRANLAGKERCIKDGEECLRRRERNILELEQRIKSTKDPQEAASYQKGIDELRSVRIPELRAAIAREKQTTVIKWAK